MGNSNKIEGCCTICKKIFYYYKSIQTGKFCSLKCSDSNSYRRDCKLGSKNSEWKGNRAGYFAKHARIYTLFGKPNECEKCGTKKEKMYHWANLSGKYKTERSDWMRLCVPCHHKLDNIQHKIWVSRRLKTKEK